MNSTQQYMIVLIDALGGLNFAITFVHANYDGREKYCYGKS